MNDHGSIREASVIHPCGKWKGNGSGNGSHENLRQDNRREIANVGDPA